MHMCYERPAPVSTLSGGVGYDKWDRDRDRGGGGGGAAGASWAGRDRERDRERERQARAHQMSHAHAAEPDASSLFPAPFRVTGNRDRVSQQIQIKLGDYHLAQTLLDDPSKSIGICAEPPSPAPCPPSRRESEFKKPAHAPQNGRVHHRPYVYNKSDAPGSTGASAHRPPNLRIPNGFQSQSAIDSSQPPIESILKEMKSLPTPLSLIAATPRKEPENKFTFNPYTNRLVQETPQTTNNDLKSPLPKPGLDNRISNSRSSPDVVNKDLGLSESDDEVAATTTRLEPILSPIGSGGSPSSGSESSQSDSESESSSAESLPTPTPAPPAAPAPAPACRSSWSLSNFAPPPAHPPEYESKELTHALDNVKEKSPISELSDSEASSPSPGARRRRSTANRSSAVSSDDEAPRPHNTVSGGSGLPSFQPPISVLSDSEAESPSPARRRTSNRSSSSDEDMPQRYSTSPRLPSAPSAPLKRGRPPKKSSAEPPKKKRGRPRKKPELEPEPVDAPAAGQPAPAPLQLQDTKTHIFRKVFTPKKGDECGGKGGKGGKGKGGKGKGQVTIIEVTAPESGADDDERHRDRSAERRNEEAIARVSPPPQTESARRRDDRSDRSSEKIDRIDKAERRSDERINVPDRATSERSSNDRIQSDRTPNDRISMERTSSDRLPMTERLSARLSDRIANDRSASDCVPTDRSSVRQTDRLSVDRHSDRRSSERISSGRRSSERLSIERLSSDVEKERLTDTRERLNDKISDKIPLDKRDRLERIPDRYVRAEADVGSGLKSGRGSERLEEASSNGRGRARVLVRIPLALVPRWAALRRPRRAAPAGSQPSDVAATNHERATSLSGQTPIYYSYFESLPADVLSDEERRDHKYYLSEAKRLRLAAEREQEPLSRVMLYLESVLCFVLTGRLLEQESDTKKAFTIYRETIEYIKSIHSMPQRFRASPHSTFSKLDILSLRVQALLYLRMFKMYNREVNEYYKIVQEYQQKPACAEAVSPLSVSPSPAGSVGSGGSGSGSGGSGSGGSGSGGTGGSSGYCSLAHAVPAHAHHALLQLTKYYTFLYVAHELWEQADALCRLRPNQDLFIAVDRKCGPLTLFSSFIHLVQYVRHAISLLKNAPRE